MNLPIEKGPLLTPVGANKKPQAGALPRWGKRWKADEAIWALRLNSVEDCGIWRQRSSAVCETQRLDCGEEWTI